MSHPFEVDQFLDRPVTLEGDYNTYAWLLQTAPLAGFGVRLQPRSKITRDNTWAYLLCGGNIYWVNVQNGAIVINAGWTWNDLFSMQLNDHSAYGTYSAHIDQATQFDLRIFRNNVLLVTFNLAPDDWWGVVVSPDGHYVVAIRRTGAARSAMIYEGV